MSWWIGYFLKYFWDSRVRGVRRPVLGGYKITHNCNLRCTHCPYWSRRSDDPDWSEVRRVIDELRERGVRILIFEGGEPLLWRDKAAGKTFADAVVYARDRFFSVGVTTNGTLPFGSIPADTIWVSFDGLPEIYRKIRGDFFDTMMTNIRNAGHSNLYANITINRLNKAELDEMVRFVSPHVRGITVQFHYPYGAAADDELFIPLAERGEILDGLLRLKKEGYPLADSRGCFEAMRRNDWQCHDWMLANANPDGTVTQGCYLKNRGDIDCENCGFAAHVEISKAFDLSLSAINTGRKIFRYRRVWA